MAGRKKNPKMENFKDRRLSIMQKSHEINQAAEIQENAAKARMYNEQLDADAANFTKDVGLEERQEKHKQRLIAHGIVRRQTLIDQQKQHFEKLTSDALKTLNFTTEPKEKKDSAHSNKHLPRTNSIKQSHGSIKHGPGKAPVKHPTASDLEKPYAGGQKKKALSRQEVQASPISIPQSPVDSPATSKHGPIVPTKLSKEHHAGGSPGSHQSMKKQSPSTIHPVNNQTDKSKIVSINESGTWGKSLKHMSRKRRATLANLELLLPPDPVDKTVKSLERTITHSPAPFVHTPLKQSKEELTEEEAGELEPMTSTETLYELRTSSSGQYAGSEPRSIWSLKRDSKLANMTAVPMVKRRNTMTAPTKNANDLEELYKCRYLRLTDSQEIKKPADDTIFPEPDSSNTDSIFPIKPEHIVRKSSPKDLGNQLVPGTGMAPQINSNKEIKAVKLYHGTRRSSNPR